MRFRHIAITAFGLAALAGCKSDITSSARPPLAGVRFINGLSDTNSVDIRMVDQVEWSAVANNIAFRAGTEHQPVEAKSRRIRVFAFVSANPTIDNVSKVLLDTSVAFTANSKVTLLLTGSARARTVRFMMLDDAVAAPATGQIALRVVNTSTGAVDAYYTPTDSTPIVGLQPSVANVAPLGVSPYTTRAVGDVAARFTDAGGVVPTASRAGPPAPVGAPGTAPAAGVNSSGSAFSVYYFPRGVAGSPQTAATPGVTWFVDRVPPAP
jgi:hypothetical protein